MPARPDSPTERLVFLHGFTQTHHHWHDIAFRLWSRLGGPTLAFVDLPGHGLSADDRLPISASGPPLGSLIGRGTVIGYSMGARFALHAALAPDAAIDRLVLIGGTAGIETPAERADRRVSDDALADRIERIGVGAFLDEWLALPLFAHLTVDPHDLDQRRRNTADGLAHSLRDAGTGAMEPLWSQLHRIDIPVLVIAGALDDKFTAIGRRLATVLPDATFGSIDRAGHAAHTERPAATVEAIAAWLVSRSPARR